jgi:hypothetical protein
MIVTGITGPGFWITEVLTIGKHTFLINEVVLISLSIFALLTIAFSLNTVFKADFDKALKGLVKMISIIILIASMIITFALSSPGDIVSTKPKLVLYAYGLMFAKLLIHLMISHIAHIEFEQFRGTILASCFTLAFISIWNNYATIET